jgi:hypothetical protein
MTGVEMMNQRVIHRGDLGDMVVRVRDAIEVVPHDCECICMAVSDDI